MNLVRTSLFSAIITFIRISSGFIVNKVVAIFTGTLGVALLGAFTNFITIVLTLANGAINTGVVKYAAEFKEDKKKLRKLFSTALQISVFCSAFTGFILFIFAPSFSSWVLNSSIYAGPIKIFGLTIIMYSLNTLLISILNGVGQIGIYTIVNTVGSVFGLIFTVILVYFYKITGALYALVLSQSIVLFITIFLITKSSWFSWNYFNGKFDKLTSLKLSHYSLMAVVSALTVPVSQIILRNMLISKIGINEGGYWQGMMRISDGYLMLITTALSTYYLPKLSSLTTNRELRSEIINGYKLIIPLIFSGCILIYFLRFFIIKLLYTPAFIEMEYLFFWQLVGDFFKLSAWVLAYLMLAKAMTKLFVITEILFSMSFVMLGYIFVHYFQLKGITIAFAFNYFIYFLVMVFIFRKLIFIAKS